jgi:alpha-L-fucosidase
MRRRDMIKAAGMLAASPLFINDTLITNDSKGTIVPSALPLKKFGDGRDWFFEKRYGMFVHWGLYSIPGWHEQHQWRAKVPRAEYVKLLKSWNPVKFDPEGWLDLMELAGMKYITITTKHHDGFCLWDTKLTGFNTMNSPYKQDVIGKLSDACHKRKVPLCLYYSIADWNHPNYPNLGRHHELPPQPQDNPDWNKYLEFLKWQVKELCTNYGEIHGFWWDMNVPVYKDPTVNDMIRKLQPKAVINNRGFDEGDFGTPERDFEVKANDSVGSGRPVEACQSVGMESWGYKKDEDYYTDRHLSRSIDRYLSQGANYLLNVGPTGEGIIPAESSSILKRLGIWYKSVMESYNDVEIASNLISNQNAMVTSGRNTIYIHFNKELTGNGFKLKPINILPKNATLLNDGSRVDCVVNLAPSDHVEQKPYLRLRNLPANSSESTVLVVKLEFDRPLSEITAGKPESGIPSEMIK